MRNVMAALIFAAGLGMGVTSSMATPISAGVGLGLGKNIVEPVQYWGGRCERLRRACEYKGERGEVGEGNCRRYRAECGGGVSSCERLRRACVNKEERGEVGEGNCRRYRNECGGRR
jgi:hypothetical protein